MKQFYISKKISFLSLLIAFVAFANSAFAQNAATNSTTSKKKIVDNGYYSYEVTGDAKTDAENESKAKDEFVRNHPEKYEQLKAAQQQSAKQAIDYKEYLQMPAAKKKHIDQNPDKYYFINK